MSRTIQEALDLPVLEDLLRPARNKNTIDEADEIDEDIDTTVLVDSIAQALNSGALPIQVTHDREEKDHADKTDDIHDEVLQHAKDLMDLGYNVDTRSAGRIFETAAGMFKIALDAKNSKRDAQLKALKLELDNRKLDALLKGKNNDNNVIPGEHVIIEDRNELIRRIRESK